MTTKTILSALFVAISLNSFAQSPDLVLKRGNEKEILSRMTLEEKVSLVIGGGNTVFTGYGNSQKYVPGSAGNTVPVPRLGIPATVLADGPAGLRISPLRQGTDKTYYCTGFPVGTAIASSWDTDLVREVGSAIGSEVREYGVDVLLAPGLNLMRDPLCGRNFEYYSEDPLLSGKMAAAYVSGVQSNGVGTSVKHFAVNNQETNRKDVDVRISERALREVYIRGFEIAVKESKPWTVMSAYNMINGQQCMESRDLLTTILRDEWGFEGIVMCDWASPGWRDSAKEIWAGNDLLTPGSEPQYQEVIKAVNDGKLSLKDLDDCVYRILRYITWTPRYKGLQYSDNPPLEKNALTARQIAAECQVLLKNEGGTLPLQGGNRKVALFGISSYDFIAGGTGSGNVNKAYVVNLLDGLEGAGLEVDAPLKEMYIEKRDASLALMQSSALGRGSLQDFLPDAEYIEGSSDRADMAIITIGRNCGEGADRHVWNDFNLTTAESNMIRMVSSAFHGKGKKVIVILNISGVVETASWKENADAILLSWLPGQEGGNSVADILTGKVNPSGRLPMTFPADYFDTPTYDNFPYDYTGPLAMGNYPKIPRPERKNVHFVNYDEGIYVGYRHFDTRGTRVSYPFGYGLSYTTFSYGSPKVSKSSDGKYSLSVEVTNTGSVPGKEVVQAYYSLSSSSVDRPVRQLVCFGKTPLLSPGEKTTVRMSFTERDLSYFDEGTHSWILEKGSYQICIGSNSRNILETATIEEKNSKTLEKVNAVLLEK
ncbi:MAG: glycoside hydrolase family 3 C-terminal domain-containing protein [Bacteroidales bacterium]|nr:glycoside hydrolase family 3 C-terminal domain-containing protein [Bacteroidales bacterium]